MRKNSIDLEKLEIEAAASILIYDREELKIFMDMYNGTIADNDIGISGPFSTFLEIINKANDAGLFDELEDESIDLGENIIIRSITKEKRLLDFIVKSQYNIYNSDDRDKFKAWFSSVVNSNVEESLAEDVIYHYIWEVQKHRISGIDKSNSDFKSKINSMPKSLTIKDNKSKILSLGEIDISLDSKSNKLFTNGLDDLDEFIRLAGTNLMIIAARPGVGKTLFMLQQAVENARGGKRIGADGDLLKPKKSLFISLEMSEKSVMDRIFGYLSQENLKDLTRKQYVKKVEEIKNKEEFKNIMDNLKILATDTNNGNSILTSIEKAVEDDGIEAVFLDYLQLLKFTGKDEWGSIREATNSLKNLAFKKNILVTTASQVSRSSTNEGLTLTDLFGGSSIESDADCVVGLEALRERTSANTNIISAKVLKNREGALTSLKYEIDYSTGVISPKNEY